MTSFYRTISYSSPDRVTTKNVRKTKSGRFLVLADPTGSAVIRLNLRRMLADGDGLAQVAFDADDVTYTATRDNYGVTVTLSSIPHTKGRYYDYGHYGDDGAPNFWVKMTLFSGEVVVAGILARNHNLPGELTPETISTDLSTESWGKFLPAVGGNVDFDISAQTAAQRQLMSQPLSLRGVTNQGYEYNPDRPSLSYDDQAFNELNVPANSPSSSADQTATLATVADNDVTIGPGA